MENKGEFSSRISTIRLRTWTLTLTIVALLVLYIFVTLSMNDSINVIDFAITATIQIITHFAYFPDGERYGETDNLYIMARKTYNTNAARVTVDSTVAELKRYCDFDYEERKHKYIVDQCADIGIGIQEFEVLAKKSPKELKKIKKFENNGETFYITKKRRKILLRLIYNKIPVEANNPDTILSAVDRDYTENIKDGSRPYRTKTHITKLIKAIVVGGVLAYIAYNLREGITFSAVVKSALFLGSMISTAVSSYISGEKSTREFRKKFYVELSVFIDKFFSWLGEKPTKTNEK